MTDKVQKIKEWISKTQDGLMDAQGNFEYLKHEGAYHILCNLDAYIDSLHEEPNTKEYLCIKDFYPYKKGKVYKSIGGGFPANAKEYFTLVEKSVSEDLKKAARKYAGIPEDSPHDLKYCVQDKKAKYDAVLYGASWQKEQMMKNAKDGVITFDYYGDNDKIYGCIAHDSFCLEELGLKDGDKVKLIIIKED